MQEMKDVTLAQIAEAFGGRVIYAPGGTVNIGCVVNNFDGPPPSKKTADKKSTARVTRAQQDKVVDTPAGQTTPPPSPIADPTDDDEGDGESNGSTSASESATTSEPASEPARGGSSGWGSSNTPESSSGGSGWGTASSGAEVSPTATAPSPPGSRRRRDRRTAAERGG
tara:strand:- start:3871 stop:4377 length:507 start_codon:yes stop_codon:yes gene_type:complete